MTEPKHTTHSNGERLVGIAADVKRLAAKVEADTDVALATVSKSGLSLLIVAGVLIAAMVVGDIIGIAGVF